MPVIENPLIYDYDISGKVGLSGDILQVWEQDALINSLKMWISSRRGGIIREPTRGGYLIDWLTKTMSETNIENLEMSIRDGIDQDFSPHLQIINLIVSPDTKKRQWNIYMEVFSPELKLRAVLDERIKATL